MSLVKMEHVHKQFGETKVLRDVNLTIQESEIVSLIGRSGSGKSTLLRCINGLEQVQSGRIVVDGTCLTDSGTDLNALRRRVGMVFQSYNLFPHLNVERNVMLALKVVCKMPDAQARDIAHSMIEKVGLVDRLHAYPDELSGGQKQRVAIARSLSMQPKIMLFDEITSALDPELVGEVLKVLESLATEGMTMVLVTHEMNFARTVATRTIFMHDGRPHEDGIASEVLTEPATPELQGFLKAVLH